MRYTAVQTVVHSKIPRYILFRGTQPYCLPPYLLVCLTIHLPTYPLSLYVSMSGRTLIKILGVCVLGVGGGISTIFYKHICHYFLQKKKERRYLRISGEQLPYLPSPPEGTALSLCLSIYVSICLSVCLSIGY